MPMQHQTNKKADYTDLRQAETNKAASSSEQKGEDNDASNPATSYHLIYLNLFQQLSSCLSRDAMLLLAIRPTQASTDLLSSVKMS